MITLYGARDGALVRLAETIPHPDAVWIDLCDPTAEEEDAVERMIGVEVPTRQEMAEIEESSRLYREDGALVVTATMMEGVGEGRPSRTQATFVLSERHLVTVRYGDPLPFRAFEAKWARQPEARPSSDLVFVALIDAIVERAADVLEYVAADLNAVSMHLFVESGPRKAKEAETDLQEILMRLGRRNMMVSILRESLLSLTRLVPFVRQNAEEWLSQEAPARLKQLERDLRSLSAYEGQLSAEIVYLQEATLGLINLAQNRVIKVLSIAAVLFLPPTLVGTIYGMNFAYMPELDWPYAYPVALAAMVVSGVASFYWFKSKGWL
ncbi:magnesium transporter CorA family protein [Salinarimonas ramus]|uniref:Magnesium transport protein CorA n=1 Tax=Salinarimonas ramus TaxID=690164 RepID=A0A917QG69_9HYPH|nr:magnesium transporter CorA family protein [Salinarimonas ramus]GGK49073.1 magnesium/cobalt transporter [Salinarimonas ramus]